MAPNLRQLTLLSDSLADVSALVRAKMAPAQSQQQQEQPSASYWDWPADQVDTPADLFSAEHLQANLEAAAATSNTASSPLHAEHDDYWAESATEMPSSRALHTQQPDDSDAYWAEESHAATNADAYWAEDNSSAVRESNPSYWDEATYTTTRSDAYWQEGANDSSDYWQDASHEPTAADAYWSMSVL